MELLFENQYLTGLMIKHQYKTRSIYPIPMGLINDYRVLEKEKLCEA
jgi:hypothetical protein